MRPNSRLEDDAIVPALRASARAPQPERWTAGPLIMAEGPSQEQREHEPTMHVFAISAAMVGVCPTAIGMLRLVAAQTRVQTLGNEFLAADAVIFGVCCFLSF